MSASKVLGVVLVGTVVLVSVRYLLLAYLLRDQVLALAAAVALVMFGIVALFWRVEVSCERATLDTS